MKQNLSSEHIDPSSNEQAVAYGGERSKKDRSSEYIKPQEHSSVDANALTKAFTPAIKQR